MNEGKSCGAGRLKRGLRCLGVMATGLGFVGSAQAMNFDLGNPQWSFSANTTARVNIGVRTQPINSHIAQNPAFDESDYKFKQGDLTNARLDLLEELNLVHRGRLGMFGVRFSGSGWYDAAYDSNVKTAPGNIPGTSIPYAKASSYYNNTYSDHTKRYYEGPSAELLDAFAFGSFAIGNVPIGIKIGQLTEFWGLNWTPKIGQCDKWRTARQ